MPWDSMDELAGVQMGTEIRMRESERFPDMQLMGRNRCNTPKQHGWLPHSA